MTGTIRPLDVVAMTAARPERRLVRGQVSTVVGWEKGRSSFSPSFPTPEFGNGKKVAKSYYSREFFTHFPTFLAIVHKTRRMDSCAFCASSGG